MQIPASKLLNPTNQKRLASWKGVTAIQLKAKTYADITKVLFAQFKWLILDQPAAK